MQEQMDGLTVLRDKAHGRHYVASRAFRPGELVLACRPDVWATLWPSPLQISLPTAAELAVLQRNPGVQVLRRDAASEGGEGSGGVFALLAAAWLLSIRALLTHGTPTWARLMTLDDNSTLRTRDETAVVQYFARALHAALEDASGPSEAEVARLLGAILVNGFGTRSNPTEAAPDGLGLFVSASLFNHSCAPNAIADFFCSGPADAVSIRALTPIAVGEPVLIAYCDTIEPRYYRRRQLLLSKGFACRCTRCEDPTDSGTFGSAIRCAGCTRGWQTEQVHEGLWVCSACGATTAEHEVWEWDRRLRARLTAVQLEPHAEKGPSQAGNRSAYSQIITDALERCHPNHAIVVQALVSALSAAKPVDGPSLEGPSVESAQETIIAAEQALGALERTAPPFDAQKADVLFQLGAARHVLARALSERAPVEEERTALFEAASVLQRALAQFRVCNGNDSAGARASHVLASVCLRAAQALSERRR